MQSAGYSYPPNTPKDWVVHCKSVGNGLPALQYLSRYLYRGVISENNIIDDDGTHVIFRYVPVRVTKAALDPMAHLCVRPNTSAKYEHYITVASGRRVAERDCSRSAP